MTRPPKRNSHLHFLRKKEKSDKTPKPILILQLQVLKIVQIFHKSEKGESVKVIFCVLSPKCEIYAILRSIP